MINFKKICRILLLAAFVCTLSGVALAVNSQSEEKPQTVNANTGTGCAAGRTEYNFQCCDYQKTTGKYVNCGKKEKTFRSCPDGYKRKGSTFECELIQTNSETNNPENTPSAGGNVKQSQSAVTGCSSDYGLFSGLITTGRTIFKGLRDLIYVVAGFGIIGVAVGGFFGNLNWKWLGAIVIALVVIASTGEIINMITGCENFTKSMITDTLK